MHFGFGDFMIFTKFLVFTFFSVLKSGGGVYSKIESKSLVCPSGEWLRSGDPSEYGEVLNKIFSKNDVDNSSFFS